MSRLARRVSSGKVSDPGIGNLIQAELPAPVGCTGSLDHSICIIQTVIQLPAPQRIEKCRVILEPPSNTTPNNLRLRLSLRESSDQDMEAPTTSAALVMHDVILAGNRSPDETPARERGVRDNISRLPLLTRLCQSAALVCAKCNDGRWQIRSGKNLVEARRILQRLAMLCGQLADIRKAYAFDHYREKKRTDRFHAPRVVKAGTQPRRVKDSSQPAASRQTPCASRRWLRRF